MERSKIHRGKGACLLARAGFFVLLSLGFFHLSSCDGVNTPGVAGSGRVLPNINGSAGEVLVVMDENSWQGDAGEHLQDILKEEIPGLPQSEPLFDVMQISPGAFENAVLYHRTIVLTTVSSGKESRLSYREDVWARPQIVLQLEASSGEELDRLIRDNDGQIQSFLIQHDRDRLIAIYRDTKDEGIQQKIVENHQIQLAVPRGYNLDFSKDEYTSVSIESSDMSQVIQVYDFPADGPDALSTENLLSKRNEFTRKYVAGPRDGSYMTISPLYPPQVFDVKMGNREVVEIRGLWELENGYMGGPFISHAVYDEARNRVVVVDGYIYYPNQKKRVKLKQVEAIVYSMELM
ncbi:MAG: DUF4837 family protein [Bacteroidales bacterium]